LYISFANIPYFRNDPIKNFFPDLKLIILSLETIFLYTLTL